MVVCYLDSSAIVKRYKTEKGTDVVEALYVMDDVFRTTSHFGCLEVEGFAARALKGRIFSKEGYDALLNGLADDLGERVYVMPVTSRIINEAIEVARKYALRGMDAIHIASGMAAQSTGAAGDDFFFVTSDKEQLAAAQNAGIKILDPEAADAMEALTKLK